MVNKKIDLLLILFLSFITLAVRLYKIKAPLADYHSWRQVDTAAVAKNFVRERKIDFFHPRFDDLSAIQSGRENPKGYRMVEFPLYQAIFTKLFFIYPQLSLEIYGRLTSIFFTIVTMLIIYLLVKWELNRLAAFFSALTFSILPFFIFFTRVILPEPTAVGFVFISIFFLYLFSKNNRLWQYFFYFLSIIFFSGALLIKPTTIFYVFPLLILFYHKSKKKFFNNPLIYLFFLISVLPFVFWRVYIQRYPEGIPNNEWLLTSVNTPEGLKLIFFKPAFFRWIFFERINNLIFGGYLTFFFILGIIFRRRRIFLMSFLLTFFSYLFVFQGGNVQHEYYQTIIFPVLSIFVGLGVESLFVLKNKLISPLILVFIVFSLYLFSIYFSFDKVKNYYQISNNLINIASIIRSLTKENQMIVTDTTGDTTLLYLSNRRGYPAVYRDLDYFKNLGAKYFYTAQKWVIEDIIKNNRYQVVFNNNQFTLFQL